jgi:L-aminopeptidase/D-esterase-like protein
MSGGITDLLGVAVGHHTDLEHGTGTTVITFPEPNVAVVDVRGGAPGTRELDAFGDAIKPVTVNALVFSGGSAFGLSAADGVVGEIEREGRGAWTPAGLVPIVPTAIVYDLMVGAAHVRPGPAEGAAAYRARTGGPISVGTVGAGTGTTVAGWRGEEARMKGGVGSASVAVEGASVGALVVLNAIGDVYTLEGEALTGGDPGALGDWQMRSPSVESTTLMCVATDAGIEDRNELRRVAVRAHDALGACVRPTHTRYDGDTAFVVSFAATLGAEPANVDAVQQGAFLAVGRAIESAVRSATSIFGVRALGGDR